MKKFLLSLIVLTSWMAPALAIGPDDITLRSQADTALAPFFHGVASGDPTPNAVIIWTRVTPESAGPVSGTWRVATDTNFTNIVQSGNFTTDSTRDYTVKLDVTGLSPNTWYYYEFTALGRNSLTGRTKTAPTSGVDQLRFAFVSCSNYPSGFFNAYARIKERNDIDAVLHLGDYIYEYKPGLGAIRTDELPNSEIIRLSDYRLRYSSYRLDPDLRKLHQQYPFMTVWDDHETANNSYMDGSDNHTPATEGPWAARKAAGQQASDEWLPNRLPTPGDPNKIWRKISYGPLADVFMLDTRLYGRTLQGALADNQRKILGDEQMAWLQTELRNSTAKWKILAQQVMVGNLNPFWQLNGTGIVLNNDQWDGYQTERKKLYDIILNNNIQNVIVLTGDIHTAWAMDLPYDQRTYNAGTGQGSVAVEFVTTSITSGSSPVPLDPLYGLVTTLLPHIKYVDLYKKGYGILDLTNDKAQGNFYAIKTIQTIDTAQTFESAWFTLPSTRWIKRASGPSPFLGTPFPQAPETPRVGTVTSIRNNSKDLILMGAYPNPFIDQIFIQFNLATTEPVQLQVFDMSGRLVKQEALGTLSKGLHNKAVDLNHLARGAYKLVISTANALLERTIEKF